MSISTNKKALGLAASVVLTAGLALTPTLASAETSPFSSTELSNGYMQLAMHHGAEEAKCGADTKTDKVKEHKCGAKDAKKAAEKAKEHKCGEGKCGANKKAHEGKCGAEKAKEGTCGK